MTLVVTNAGLAAVTKANDLGIQIKVTDIGLGTDGYVPDASMTALKNEVIRKPFDFGEVVDVGHLRFGVQLDGDLVIDAKEIAYYLEDGTVFAIESRNGEVISMKRANTVTTEFFEMVLRGELISAITVAVHDHPFANETTPGVIRIATAEDVAEGSDDTAALTIKKMLLRRATLDQLGVTQLSNLINGTREDRAATEKAVGEVNALLDELKATHNPFPQYWHNDEVATNAEAIAGTTNGKILTVLRGMEMLKSRVSSSLTGTRSDYAASESALKTVYDKAVSAYNLANEKWSAVSASTTVKGIVQLTTSVSSTSTVLAATASAVKTAYDKAVSAYNLANEKWSAVNASTTVKGIVQLSTSVSSTSTVLAATASAVKAAYDKAVSAYNLANGKWTAVNGSTSVKGILQLSTSTSSTSTTLAATPSAVKAAMDKANSAYSKADGNTVYSGSSKAETNYPIGHHLIAWVGSGNGMGYYNAQNTHHKLYVSTNTPTTWTSEEYGNHVGAPLLGTWAHRGVVGTPGNVWTALMQRVL